MPNCLSSAPIGLFDSGMGGLSVYTHLHACLPNERFIYYADLLNVPYGNRTEQNIVALTKQAVDWLVGQGCKLIVIACNSASAYALASVRACHPTVPIVGLVPALKPAVLASQTKSVGILATKATLEGALLQAVIEDFAIPNGVQVNKHFDAQLVPWVEAGMPQDDEVATRLCTLIHTWAQHGMDYVVLGCTHYPFFRPMLEQYIAQHHLNMTVVDSGTAIANRVQTLLRERQLQASASASNASLITHTALTFCSTDNRQDATKIQKHIQRLMGSDMMTQVVYL